MKYDGLETVGIDAEVLKNEDKAQKCADQVKKLMDVMAQNRESYENDPRFEKMTSHEKKMMIDVSFLITRSSNVDVYIYEILNPRLESIEARLKELELQREVR